MHTEFLLINMTRLNILGDLGRKIISFLQVIKQLYIWYHEDIRLIPSMKLTRKGLNNAVTVSVVMNICVS
jgi:hypothetical protein